MMPPAKGAFSTRSVLTPALEAARAAAVPAHPAPQTRTSVSMVREVLAGCFESAAVSGTDAAVAAPRAAAWMKFRREWLCMGFIFWGGWPERKAIKIVRCQLTGSIECWKQYHTKMHLCHDKLCMIYDLSRFHGFYLSNKEKRFRRRERNCIWLC
jgi:hypothetical protein